MSCNNNTTKLSRTAAAKAGISTLSSQATAAIVQTAATATQRVQNAVGQSRTQAGQSFDALNRRVGQASALLVNTADKFELPQSIDSLTPVAAVAALVSSNKTRLKMLNAITALQLGRTLSAGVGTGLARLSRPSAEAIRTETFFDHRTPPVHIWRSKATTALNTQNIMRWPGTSIELSSGQMMETAGKSWHLGTIVAAVGHSQQTQTITHLQSMNFPATHYYFNRPLSEREAAGIILGRREFEAKHLPGFAGQVSELGSLQPSMAYMKKAMIQASILWGDAPPAFGPNVGGKAKLEAAQQRQRRVSGQGYAPQRYDLAASASLSAMFGGRQCSQPGLKRVLGSPSGDNTGATVRPVGSGQGGRQSYILAGRLGDVHYTTSGGAAEMTVEAVVPRQGEANKMRGIIKGLLKERSI